jgi:hypothetical protein
MATLLQNACIKKITPSFYKGKVENRFTHEPLSGVQIQVVEQIRVYRGIMDSYPLDIIKDQIISNEKGEFSFKLDSLKQGKVFLLKFVNNLDADSGNINNKFCSDRFIFNSFNRKDEKLASLTPFGFVNISIDDSTWKTTSSDSILVECLSIRQTPKYFIRNKVNQLLFNELETSKAVEFRFYCIRHNVKESQVSQEIFTLNTIYHDRFESRKLNLIFK